MFTQAALLFLPVSMFHLFLVLFTFSFCKFRLLFPFARSLSDPASLTVWLFWPKTNAMSILARGNTTSTTKDWLTHTRGWQSTKEKMSSFRHLILVWRVSLKLIISRKMKRQFFKTLFQPLFTYTLILWLTRPMTGKSANRAHAAKFKPLNLSSAANEMGGHFGLTPK